MKVNPDRSAEQRLEILSDAVTKLAADLTAKVAEMYSAIEQSRQEDTHPEQTSR